MNLLIESTRLAITIIVLLILPGYTLVFALFPIMKGDSLSRFFFSVLTSICITVCTAYTLMKVRAGLLPQELFVTLEVLTLLFAIAGWIHYRYARSRLDLAGTHNLVRKSTAPNIGGVLKTIVAVTIIAFSGRAFSTLIAPSQTEQPMTEFHIDVQHIHADGIEMHREDGLVLLPITIRNLEGEDRVYRIKGMIDGELIYESDPIEIHDQISWTRDIPLHLEASRQKGSLDLLLFATGKEEPIAQLDFWLADNQSAIAQFGNQ